MPTAQNTPPLIRKGILLTDGDREVLDQHAQILNIAPRRLVLDGLRQVVAADTYPAGLIEQREALSKYPPAPASKQTQLAVRLTKADAEAAKELIGRSTFSRTDFWQYVVSQSITRAWLKGHAQTIKKVNESPARRVRQHDTPKRETI